MSALIRRWTLVRGMLWASLVTVTPPLSGADTAVSSELLDLAGRIEYGYYARQARVIEAARVDLARSAEEAYLGDYYDALAAYRLAQLSAAADGRGLGDLLEECVEHAEASRSHGDAAAEAWILIAACSALGVRYEPLKGSLHQRRLEHALEQAERIEAENPRIPVVEAWALSQRPAHETAEVQEEARARLEQALAQFRLWSAPPGWPDWGEAEALAHLGEIHLQRGAAREARDCIEQALLLAPDYDFALALRKRVLSSR